MTSKYKDTDKKINKEWEKLDIMSRDKIEDLTCKIVSLESKIISMESALFCANEKMSLLEQDIKTSHEKLANIEKILVENRSLYLNYIKQNHDITCKVVEILEENRKLYLNAINDVEHKEDENIKTLKPILEDVSRQNELLQKNLSSPFLMDRVYNRFWRVGGYKNPYPHPVGLASLFSEKPDLDDDG